jgi:hypothetical protein
MSTLTLESPAVANLVSFDDSRLIVQLADGRSLAIPLEWYPRLQYATTAEREQWELLGDGYAIEWPALDEHLGIEGLLAGRRSGESQKSLERWLAGRG